MSGVYWFKRRGRQAFLRTSLLMTLVKQTWGRFFWQSGLICDRFAEIDGATSDAGVP